MLLESILAEVSTPDDFSQTVSRLADDFRANTGLGPFYQLGLVVPDVVRAAEDLRARGMGNFVLGQGPATMWIERGSPKSVKNRLGMGGYGGIELELLEPGMGTDFYRNNLDPEGRTRIQHLGFSVKNVDAEAERLETLGFKTIVRGSVVQGPGNTQFAFMDTTSECGFIVEFISSRIFGLHLTTPILFYRVLGWMERISGIRIVGKKPSPG